MEPSLEHLWVPRNQLRGAEALAVVVPTSPRGCWGLGVQRVITMASKA